MAGFKCHAGVMARDLIHLLTCWWLGMTRYDSLNSWEMNARATFRLWLQNNPAWVLKNMCTLESLEIDMIHNQ